jgi:hypothetical protein
MDAVVEKVVRQGLATGLLGSLSGPVTEECVVEEMNKVYAHLVPWLLYQWSASELVRMEAEEAAAVTDPAITLIHPNQGMS